MTRTVLVVGGGIIGASIALNLVRAGARVTVLDAGHASATASSFGWINASFYLDEDHHRLRAAGLAAWHRLSDTCQFPLRWQGCLCWDMPADKLQTTYDTLTNLGYPVAQITRAQFVAKEPAVADPPDGALFFPTEGAVDSVRIAGQLLAAAQAAGARVVRNLAATRVLRDDARVTGVDTALGPLFADEVLVAAGVGTTALTGDVIPLKPRPAYMLRSAPQPPLLSHVLAAPIGEIRQEEAGHLLMPTAVSHQADSATVLADDPVAVADAAFSRMQALLPSLRDGHWCEIVKAERPVPADDKPVVGRVEPGLYVATLHSGITLGPLVGELAAREIMGGADNETTSHLAPYRPSRFSGG